MVWALLTILGAVGAIVGIYAYVESRRNRRVKALVYEHEATIPLASPFNDAAPYNLSILYERPNQETQVVKGAFVSFVRFANLGREPIRASDIAPHNPLRIDVHMGDSGEVLDMSLATSRRDVTQVAVEPLEERTSGGSAKLTFDFLDYLDGGVVQVLCTRSPEKIELVGDIIGMPDGIARAKAGGFTLAGFWGAVVAALFTLLVFGALVLCALIFRWETGGWSHVWLIALPLLAVVMPLAIFIAVAMSLSADRTKFPKELGRPKWAYGYGFWMIEEGSLARGRSADRDDDSRSG